MQIDAAVVAVLVTILLAIIAVAFGYGVLTQKVKGNRFDIDEHKNEQKETINQIRAEFKAYELNNRGDHALIFTKLDKIIENGNKKA